MAFESKTKEPLLSLEMQDLIDKTHGDSKGDKYDDIERYKYLIMKLLTEDQDFLSHLLQRISHRYHVFRVVQR